MMGVVNNGDDVTFVFLHIAKSVR